MRVLGTGHAAVIVGDRTVVFDKGTFIARGGVVTEEMIIGAGGWVDVDADLAETLVQSGAGALPEEAAKVEAAGPVSTLTPPGPPDLTTQPATITEPARSAVHPVAQRTGAAKAKQGKGKAKGKAKAKKAE